MQTYFQEAANVSNPEGAIRSSLRTDKAVDKWTSCCRQALQCCQSQLNLSHSTRHYAGGDVGAPACPALWDGWQCWQPTRANEIAYAACPHYIYFDTEPPACTRESINSNLIRFYCTT